MTDAPRPGWYDDPESPAHIRYWDGSTWTTQVQPRPDQGSPQNYPDPDPPAAAPAPTPPPSAPEKKKPKRSKRKAPPRFTPSGPTLFDLPEDEFSIHADTAPPDTPQNFPPPQYAPPAQQPSAPKKRSSPKKPRRPQSSRNAIDAALAAERPPSKGVGKAVASWVAVVVILGAGAGGYWWLMQGSDSSAQACSIISSATSEPAQTLRSSYPLAMSADPQDPATAGRIETAAAAGQSLAAGAVRGFRAGAESRDEETRRLASDAASRYEIVEAAFEQAGASAATPSGQVRLSEAVEALNLATSEVGQVASRQLGCGAITAI